jgi:hypothetical protein
MGLVCSSANAVTLARSQVFVSYALNFGQLGWTYPVVIRRSPARDESCGSNRVFQLNALPARKEADMAEIWVVLENPPQHPGKFIARLVTDPDPSQFLVANTLDEIRAKLPPRLVRMEPQPDLPQAQGVVELWTHPSSTGSASKGPFEDAMSLLTAMSTATQLFVGLTGAVWVVVVPNTMALPTSLVVLALFLHALLGLVMFLVLRGLGANLEQRLNLSRWREYGDQKGMGDAAWFGVPPLRYGIKKTGCESARRNDPTQISDVKYFACRSASGPHAESQSHSLRQFYLFRQNETHSRL